MLENRQNTFVGGSVVVIRLAKSDGSYDNNWFDLGTIEPVAPQRTQNKLELKDSRGGVATTVGTRIIDTSTAFNIKTFNLSPRTWQIFLGSDTIATFTQSSATDATTTAQNVFANSMVEVISSGGDRIYDLTALTVKIGATTLVRGTDWDMDAVDAKVGMFRLFKPAGLTDGTTDLDLTYSCAAITGGRLLTPGQKLEFTAQAKIIQSEGGSSTSNLLPWEGLVVKLSGSANDLPQNNWGSITLQATILSQNSATPEGTARFLGPIVG